MMSKRACIDEWHRAHSMVNTGKGPHGPAINTCANAHPQLAESNDIRKMSQFVNPTAGNNTYSDAACFLRSSKKQGNRNSQRTQSVLLQCQNNNMQWPTFAKLIPNTLSSGADLCKTIFAKTCNDITRPSSQGEPWGEHLQTKHGVACLEV